MVVDEAHVLESVFGSNFSFLFRRLLVAARLTQRSSDPHEVQVVAASATISNAANHLQALTGLEFISIGEQDDGSPKQRRQIVHIASAPGDEAKTAETIHRHLAEDSTSGSFITFVDSRQGVERLAIRANLESAVRHIEVATKPQIAPKLNVPFAQAVFGA